MCVDPFPRCTYPTISSVWSNLLMDSECGGGSVVVVVVVVAGGGVDGQVHLLVRSTLGQSQKQLWQFLDSRKIFSSDGKIS